MKTAPGKCYYNFLQSDAEQALVRGNPAFETPLNECAAGQHITLVSFGEEGLQQLLALRRTTGCTDALGCSDGHLYAVTESGAERKDGKPKYALPYWERRGRKLICSYRKAEKRQQKDAAGWNGDRESAVLSDGAALLFPSFRRLKYYSAADDFFHHFRLYAPRGKSGGLPLLVFLHGAGGIGEDNTRQMWELLFLRIRLLLHRRKCVLLAPQLSCVKQYNSDAHSAMLGELLVWVQREKQTDPARIYLAGLSYGAHAVFYEAMRRPERYAAAMILSGWWYTQERAESFGTVQDADRWHAPLDDDSIARLCDVPLLFVHSENDKSCPAGDVPAEDLRRLGADVRYEKYQRFGHGVFIPFSLGRNWDGWMFQQKKQKK